MTWWLKTILILFAFVLGLFVLMIAGACLAHLWESIVSDIEDEPLNNQNTNTQHN